MSEEGADEPITIDNYEEHPAIREILEMEREVVQASRAGEMTTLLRGHNETTECGRIDPEHAGFVATARFKLVESKGKVRWLSVATEGHAVRYEYIYDAKERLRYFRRSDDMTSAVQYLDGEEKIGELLFATMTRDLGEPVEDRSPQRLPAEASSPRAFFDRLETNADPELGCQRR